MRWGFKAGWWRNIAGKENRKKEPGTEKGNIER